MRATPLEKWVDRNFSGVVVPLVVIGCVRVGFYPASGWMIALMVVPWICSSVGCGLWAVHLRASSPLMWFFIGLLVPWLLPVMYWLGWRPLRSQPKGPPPVDCPRCGMRVSEKGKCPNCAWNHATA